MTKHQDVRPTKHTPAEPRPIAAGARGPHLLLAATTALIVATPLLPSEAAIPFGAFAPLSMLWCLLLAAWAGLMLWRPELGIRLGWTEACFGGLIAWHSLSAIVASTRGNGRQSLNALWLWIGYGIVLFLLRQLVRTKSQGRALVAVMLALGVCLSAHAYYQYFVSLPQMRAEFARNPERMLVENGISTDPNSPQYRQFKNRVESVEPLASFALTNSLAGYLAPWLVAALGIVLVAWSAPEQRRAALIAAGITATLAGCLLLTKSRTGVLAAGSGAMLMLLYGRPSGWRLGWKIPAALVTTLLLLGLGVVLVGGLDVKVLSEAPKSVLYRLEYWQATAAMIGDYPLLGCGPGNFQEYYAHYKLPGASETVADPHNFLLEIGATAGTPALLLLGLALGSMIYALSRPGTASSDESSLAKMTSSAIDSSEGVAWIYGGAATGLFLAFALGLMVNYPLEIVEIIALPVVWLVGIPAGGICLWLLHDWTVRGTLSISLPVVALVTLGINLLAAGAAGFPGVFVTACVLVPLALVAKGEMGSAVRASPVLASLGLTGSLLLLLACLQTEYRPVLLGQMHLNEARSRQMVGDYASAERAAREAAAADRWSPEPWRFLAELELQKWLQSGVSEDFERFVVAANQYRAQSPSHFAQYQQRGNWYLQIWRKKGDRPLLDEARAAYEQAAIRYPSNALQHAQLAWAWHLAGNPEQAAHEADVAWRLDSQNPHLDQKLENQRLSDPQASDQDVKQIVSSLRKKT